MQRSANIAAKALRTSRRWRDTHRTGGLSVWVGAMGKSDAGYDYDRYRRLLAEADDEPKRMAFINLLLDEKAKDKLAEQALHVRLAGMGLTAKPKA
jgi:hypothetical protein